MRRRRTLPMAACSIRSTRRNKAPMVGSEARPKWRAFASHSWATRSANGGRRGFHPERASCMTTLTFRKPSALPGFGLTLGITVAYLSLVVLIPLAATFLKTASLDWSQFVRAVASPRVLASYRLTFFSALDGALINAVFGFLVAWVLVRYTFPFKRIVDAVVDLPFALPTSVAGISLAAVYAGNGWIGQFLAPLGIKIAFTPAGVLIALTFIGLPFVVRTVQ